MLFRTVYGPELEAMSMTERTEHATLAVALAAAFASPFVLLLLGLALG